MVLVCWQIVGSSTLPVLWFVRVVLHCRVPESSTVVLSPGPQHEMGGELVHSRFAKKLA